MRVSRNETFDYNEFSFEISFKLNKNIQFKRLLQSFYVFFSPYLNNMGFIYKVYYYSLLFGNTSNEYTICQISYFIFNVQNDLIPDGSLAIH